MDTLLNKVKRVNNPSPYSCTNVFNLNKETTSLYNRMSKRLEKLYQRQNVHLFKTVSFFSVARILYVFSWVEAKVDGIWLGAT